MNLYSLYLLSNVLAYLRFVLHHPHFTPCSQITVIAVISFDILGHCVFLNSRVLQPKLKIVAEFATEHCKL